MEKVKEYLKMADEFSLPVKEDTLEVYCRQHIGKSFGSCEAYSAHAINSHDELVAEVEQLRAELVNNDILFNCAKEAIRYCNEELCDDDAAIFLRLWSNAEWDILRKEFPDANDIIYAADPLWNGWITKGDTA